MDSLVSVIIPVLNAEETIERCMDSLLNQTWRALEILVVDGGSTDGTLERLDAYARRDSRVRVLRTNEHTGVAEARNWAIQQARGAYLQFADGDDWAEQHATERMVRTIEQNGSDMVIAGYTEVIGALRNRRGILHEDELLTQEQFLDDFSRCPNAFYYSVLWNKLYRRDLVIAHEVCCDPALSWGEDFAFNVAYYRWAKSVSVLADSVYSYVRNPHGLTLAMFKRCLKHPMDAARIKRTQYRRYVALYRSAGLYPAYRRRLRKYLYSFALVD